MSFLFIWLFSFVIGYLIFPKKVLLKTKGDKLVLITILLVSGPFGLGGVLIMFLFIASFAYFTEERCEKIKDWYNSPLKK